MGKKIKSFHILFSAVYVEKFPDVSFKNTEELPEEEPEKRSIDYYIPRLIADVPEIADFDTLSIKIPKLHYIRGISILGAKEIDGRFIVNFPSKRKYITIKIKKNSGKYKEIRFRIR